MHTLRQRLFELRQTPAVVVEAKISSFDRFLEGSEASRNFGLKGTNSRVYSHQLPFDDIEPLTIDPPRMAKLAKVC